MTETTMANTEKPTVDEIMEAVKAYGRAEAVEAGSGRGADTSAELDDVRYLVQQLAATPAPSASGTDEQKLHDALYWLVNLHHGVGKGVQIADGEWEDALEEATALLNARASRTKTTGRGPSCQENG